MLLASITILFAALYTFVWFYLLCNTLTLWLTSEHWSYTTILDCIWSVLAGLIIAWIGLSVFIKAKHPIIKSLFLITAGMVSSFWATYITMTTIDRLLYNIINTQLGARTLIIILFICIIALLPTLIIYALRAIESFKTNSAS